MNTDDNIAFCLRVLEAHADDLPIDKGQVQAARIEHDKLHEDVDALGSALKEIVHTYRGIRPDAPDFRALYFAATPILMKAQQVVDERVIQ